MGATMIKTLVISLLFPLFLYGGWAEKTLETLTVEEKIGQLFVVPACPRYEVESLKKLLTTCHIGNVIVKQGHPLDQVPFLNDLQGSSALPILVTGDAEWGLGMRMEETLSFPKNDILGKHPEKIPAVGRIIGEQCRMVGIHLNFAPVVDVNSNPDNPIIGARAFGSDANQVAACGRAMILAMKQGGVLTCAKHFPGHGDVDVDSHKGLPRIPHSRKHLDAVEFVPFKKAISAGVDAVMTGHLMMPALDDQDPASLSYPIVTTLLQKEWGFQGLIITDALNMKALSENYTTEEIALKALLAGHDLLLYGAHRYDDVELLLIDIVPTAYQALLKAYQEGQITDACLDSHVLKILKIKEALGLHQERFIALPEDLMEKLHPEDAVSLETYLSSSSRISTSASSMSGFFSS